METNLEGTKTDRPTYRPTTNQTTSHPTYQPENQPASQPASQSVNQTTNQTTNQPINQSNKQPNNQPASQPNKQTTKTTNQPTNNLINNLQTYLLGRTATVYRSYQFVSYPCQAILRSQCNPKLHDRIHHSPPLVLTLSRMNPASHYIHLRSLLILYQSYSWVLQLFFIFTNRHYMRVAPLPCLLHALLISTSFIYSS